MLDILLTWPRVTYLDARMPNTRDQSSYTWGMWWTAHQVVHLASPFTTKQIFAPVGVGLAYHALMPLIGVIMLPITLTAGPTFSVNLISIALPALLCYAMYRAARLWLPPPGAFASGLFFGLSPMLAYRSWFHANIALGVLFLPIALEAAVRLRRDQTPRNAAALGLVLGLCLLVDLQSEILVAILVAIVLAGWLVRRPTARKVMLLGLAGAVALLAGSPEIVAILHQSAAAASDPRVLASDYVMYNVALTQMFAPSPRVAAFGLHALGHLFYDGIQTEGMPTFGVTLTALALLGAAIGWRSRRERAWLVLWLCACLLALGPTIYLGTRAYSPLPAHYHGQTVSLLMPFTWFVRLPGLSGFREANRFTPLGLVAASLLAGSAVIWIRERFPLALGLVAAIAVLELGWSVESPTGTMPTGLPAVDRVIAADHSQSLVVDVPLGFRSGTRWLGLRFPAEEQVEATLDGHPRAIGYVSRMPEATAKALGSHAFYSQLMSIQVGRRDPVTRMSAASADARRMNVGWVLVWYQVNPAVFDFLTRVGFRFRYRADGVSVYQRAQPT